MKRCDNLISVNKTMKLLEAFFDDSLCSGDPKNNETLFRAQRSSLFE